MRITAPALAVISSLSLSLACGSTNTQPLGSDGGGGGGGSPVCPSAEPQGGSACTKAGLVCSYGNDPRPDCRPTATCTNGQWTTSTPCGPAPMPSSCPSTIDMAQGMTCMPDKSMCNYGGLGCTCTNCVDGPVTRCMGADTWHCDQPNMTAGCPAAPPNFGDACTSEGAVCGYGCKNIDRNCTGGIWVPGQRHACPISSRVFKQNIEYLSESDLLRLEEELRAIRLATYEYKEAAPEGRRHLGFIIEDNGAIPAIEADREHVDLYGYTSMAVAAIEVQAKRIEALERRVRELEARESANRKIISSTARASPSRSPGQ